MLPQSTIRAILCVFLAILAPATAHTWIEQLMVIAPNGTMIGQPGFPRSNILRTTPGFNDGAMVFLIPPNGGPANKIDVNQLMCRPEQTKQTQGKDSPRLKAIPGQAVALRYQENGHVTLPKNQPGKPVGGGANFVYFASNSKPDDKFLQIHRQWTADGKGGDSRGKLISTQNFDDGQCYQINGDTISRQRQLEFKHEGDTLQGQALWCQQDIQIPADAQPGSTVTLYWVWDWPTLPGTPGFPEGKQEIYTTCMDIDIIAPSSGTAKVLAKGFVQQDLANAAASAQFANIANPTAVKAQLIPFSGINVASSSASTSLSASASSSSTSGAIKISPIASDATRSSTTSVVRGNTVVSPSPKLTPTSTTIGASNTISTPSSEITVTFRKTVTASVTPTSTLTGLIRGSASLIPIQGERPTNSAAIRPTVTITATETDPVTVFITKTISNANKQGTQPSSTPSSPAQPVTPLNNIPSVPPSTPSCSKAQPAYRLRARNPFYILPSQDQPQPVAGNGC